MPTIHIDTSQLTNPSFLIPGQTGWISGATSPPVVLPAGIYHFQQVSGFYADFTFEVKTDGTVSYTDDCAAFLGGRGTSTLVVSGFTVRIDGTALSHGLMVLGITGGFLEPSSTHDVRLVPASGYGFQPGSGTVAALFFKVDLSGNVVIDPKYMGFAAASGSTLTIAGYKVVIDGTSLSHDLLPIMMDFGGGFLSRLTTHTLTVIPSSGYSFQPGSGIVASLSWGMDTSGNLLVAAQYAGFASVIGNTLTITGYTVTIDGTALSHDLLPISLAGYTDGFLSRSSTRQLTLIPAAGYTFQPGSGIVADMAYTVDTDGSITFPATCSGFLSAQAPSTLVVRGYPILVDATAADSDLLSLVNVAVNVEAHRYVFAVLVPCQGYGLQTANGIFAHGFNVERDGSVTFNPSVAGKLVASTVARLEIHGATPF
jgi:hypothetical protein